MIKNPWRMCCDGTFHQTHKTVMSAKGTQQAGKSRQRLMSCLMKQEQFFNCSDIWEGKDVVKVKPAFPFLSCTYWWWLIVVSGAYHICRYQKRVWPCPSSPQVQSLPSCMSLLCILGKPYPKVRHLFCVWGSLEDLVKNMFHEESGKKVRLHHKVLPWHKLLSKILKTKIFTLKTLSEKVNFLQEILLVRLFNLFDAAGFLSLFYYFHIFVS